MKKTKKITQERETRTMFNMTLDVEPITIDNIDKYKGERFVIFNKGEIRAIGDGFRVITLTKVFKKQVSIFYEPTRTRSKIMKYRFLELKPERIINMDHL